MDEDDLRKNRLVSDFTGQMLGSVDTYAITQVCNQVLNDHVSLLDLSVEPAESG